MNPSLALVVWFFAILIVFFIFWYFAGYSFWQSLTMATLISLITLIIVFPWNLEHHHADKDCHHFGNSAFVFIVVLSLIILIGYIISTYIYDYRVFIVEDIRPAAVVPMSTVVPVSSLNTESVPIVSRMPEVPRVSNQSI